MGANRIIRPGDKRPPFPPRHRRNVASTSLQKHEQAKSYVNRRRNKIKRLTTGLSPGREARFVPGCRPVERRLFVSVNPSHARHVWELFRPKANREAVPGGNVFFYGCLCLRRPLLWAFVPLSSSFMGVCASVPSRPGFAPNLLRWTPWSFEMTPRHHGGVLRNPLGAELSDGGNLRSAFRVGSAAKVPRAQGVILCFSAIFFLWEDSCKCRGALTWHSLHLRSLLIERHFSEHRRNSCRWTAVPARGTRCT